jgi:PAS domain S-box-containing protein
MTGNSELYEAAFQSVPAPALLIKADGRLEAINAAAVEALRDTIGCDVPRPGAQPEPVLPWLAADLACFVESEREEATFRKEVPLRGRLCSLEIRLKRLPNGERAALLVTLHDVTALHRAEDELRRSEDRNRTLLESLPQRIFFKDRSGAFVSVNQSFATDHGLRPYDLIGRTDYDLFPEDLADKYRLDDVRVMETGRVETLVEANIVQGRSRYVEVVKAPFFSDDGEVIGILGVFTDVTERKQMEDELAHERDLLQTLMQSMPDLIYFKDREARFTRVNDSQAIQLGLCDPGEAVGKTDFDFYPEDLARQFQADEQEIIESGEPLISKVEVLVREGSPPRWVLTTKAPVFDAQDRAVGIVGMGHDITPRVLAEERLKQTLEELARSNEELQQFAYVASHDLQEPLRMVASYTQLLSRRYKDRLDDDANDFIAYAVDGATRMQGLIHDLLAYSRVGTQARPLEPAPLDDLFRRAVSNLQMAIEEAGAQVTCDPLPMLTVDASQLVQLFQNLAGNAIKFRGDAPPAVHVSAVKKGHDWTFRVRDNGIGIEPEYAERIFVIFQRLHGKTEYPGSGIGLAICKKIVTRHGGRLWVEGEPGKGSTFCFTLPDTGARQK